VKELFAATKIEYLEYKLDKHFNRSQFYEEFEEGATFPQVQIDNKHIGGCKETLKYLQEKNMI
jgi:glutaredoxin